MQTQSSLLRRLGTLTGLLLIPVVLLAAVLLAVGQNAQASSHREAPLISKDPFADNTDTYAFVSPNDPNRLVLVASWIPFEGPEGGPNYYEWDDNVYYDSIVVFSACCRFDMDLGGNSRVFHRKCLHFTKLEA